MGCLREAADHGGCERQAEGGWRAGGLVCWECRLLHSSPQPKVTQRPYLMPTPTATRLCPPPTPLTLCLSHSPPDTHTFHPPSSTPKPSSSHSLPLLTSSSSIHHARHSIASSSSPFSFPSTPSTSTHFPAPPFHSSVSTSFLTPHVFFLQSFFLLQLSSSFFFLPLTSLPFL